MYNFVQVSSSSPRQVEQETLKMRRMHSREPWLFDLTNFAEDEMTLVSDPLYSRDAEELGKVNISKKLKVGSRCPLCNENHDIEVCVFFLQQTLEE